MTSAADQEKSGDIDNATIRTRLSMALEEAEQQDIASLREVVALAKSKGLKFRYADDTVCVIGTPDRRSEHGKTKVSDQQIPLGDRERKHNL